MQLGVSFTPQAGFQDANADATGGHTASDHNAVSFGVGYEGEFSGVSLALSFASERIELADNVADNGVDDSDTATWTAGGINLGYDAFTFGVSYGAGDLATDGTGLEGDSLSVGVAYSMGAADVSFGYATGEATDESSTNTSAQDDERTTDIYELGFSYDVGPGISWQSSVVYVSFDGDDVDSGGTALTAGNQESGDGWVVGTGFRLDF